MTKHDRCPTCDRHECDRATVPAVGGPVPACAGQAVDWRTRALAAERLLSDERAAHAETSRDLDALLTALGAQVTPGGQTLAACHARLVADGMRLAKRAAESAPAKCSCTSEVGDSRCLAHPTCAECGAFTPSCVDACADHVKPAPAVPARSEVPADVEAAIVSLVAAARDATNYEPDRTTAAKHLAAERLVKESIANLRTAIAAEIERARAEGRAESPAAPATVDELLATAPVGAIIECERDEPGKFAQIKIVPGRIWRRRSWADGAWWSWGDVSVLEIDVLKRRACLVPASEAEADPETRGPIVKKGS